MDVNSKSNWLVSMDPATQGVHGGTMRPDAKLSKSMSLLCHWRERRSDEKEDAIGNRMRLTM
jgi:hypothetical protein